MFWNCYRFKLAVTVTGNGDDRLSMVGLDFLRITAISGIAGVIIGHGILFISPMGIHFTLEHFLQYLGMQLFKKLAYIGFCLELTNKLLT